MEDVDGQFYVGTDPPAGATMLGVYYPHAGKVKSAASIPPNVEVN